MEQRRDGDEVHPGSGPGARRGRVPAAMGLLKFDGSTVQRPMQPSPPPRSRPDAVIRDGERTTGAFAAALRVERAAWRDWQRRPIRVWGPPVARARAVVERNAVLDRRPR